MPLSENSEIHKTIDHLFRQCDGLLARDLASTKPRPKLGDRRLLKDGGLRRVRRSDWQVGPGRVVNVMGAEEAYRLDLEEDIQKKGPMWQTMMAIARDVFVSIFSPLQIFHALYSIIFRPNFTGVRIDVS